MPRVQGWSTSITHAPCHLPIQLLSCGFPVAGLPWPVHRPSCTREPWGALMAEPSVAEWERKAGSRPQIPHINFPLFLQFSLRSSPLYPSWCLPRGKLHEPPVFSGHSWGWKLPGVCLLLTQPSDQPFIPLSMATGCHQALSLWWALS